MKDIIRDIENFGECFIGTADVQGLTVFRRFKRLQKEWQKNHNTVLAYDSHTGICWEI